MSFPSVPLTRFVLIEPSHAGNVGAAARAIKVMGFDELVLVRPRWPNVLKRQETIARASGALDVINAARIEDCLERALDGVTHLCATVMTARDFGPPTLPPREHFSRLMANPQNWPSGVAFVFGCERFGMKNEDVYRCHAALSIPSNPAFGSLNLAAAIQLIAYEWRMTLMAAHLDWSGAPLQKEQAAKEEGTSTKAAALAARARTADAAQLAGALSHWQRALVHLDFLDPQKPRKLMPRLEQLFKRAQPSVAEIDILRGIASAMERAQVSQAPLPPPDVHD